MNVSQVFVTSVGLLLMMSPLLLLAFLAGRRSSREMSLRKFDRLPVDSFQISGIWRGEFVLDDPSELRIIQFELTQVGSRFIANGRSSDATRYSLEGIVFERRIHCICIEEHREDPILETLTAEFLPTENRMVGMRTCWSPQLKALIVRKVMFLKTA